MVAAPRCVEEAWALGDSASRRLRSGPKEWTGICLDIHRGQHVGLHKPFNYLLQYKEQRMLRCSAFIFFLPISSASVDFFNPYAVMSSTE